jgi:hypothetical protein
MVKTRSRSKISPGAKIDALRRSATIIKSDQDLNAKVGLFAKSRFNQPSTARSLPSLALSANERKENARRSTSKVQVTRPEQRVKSAAPKDKETASKSVKNPSNQKLVKELAPESKGSVEKEDTLQLPPTPHRLMNGISSPTPSDSENSSPEHNAKSEKGDSDRYFALVHLSYPQIYVFYQGGGRKTEPRN